MESANDRAVFVLASGQTLRILGLNLYPADDLAKVAQLRAQGTQKLGGISSGIGVIGSPGLALGAGAAIGLLEGLVSNSVKSEGARILIEAERLADATRSKGRLFAARDVLNFDQPNPNTWMVRTATDVKLYVGAMSRRDRAQTLNQHGKSEADVNNGNITVPSELTFVHNGDDFLACNTEFGLMNVRWSGVVGFTGPER